MKKSASVFLTVAIITTIFGFFGFNAQKNLHQIDLWSRCRYYNTTELYASYIRQYPEGKHIEEATWRISRKNDDLASYNSYIEKFPKGKHIEEAKWRLCLATNSETEYDNYIKKYPKGKYFEEALLNKALLLKSENAVNEYLKAYPSSIYRKPLKVALNSEVGKFIDERDGKEYGWAKIGEQVWMSENLNYETPNSRCAYTYSWSREEDNIQDCEKFGRLYLWDEAQVACPNGWRLPDDDDWKTLEKYIEWEVKCVSCSTFVDNKIVPAPDAMSDKKHLLLQSKNGWSEGNNATGFSAIPHTEDLFEGPQTSWLSSSAPWINEIIGIEYVTVWRLRDFHFGETGNTKSARFYIRCIKAIE
jgi:uncharacterized protein (TIGR02145 family)